MNPWLNSISLLGMVVLCAIAWVGSENRKIVPWRVIAWGIGLQLLLGALVFWLPPSRAIFLLLNDGVSAVLDATEAGARFIFGDLLVPNPAVVPGPVLAGRWIARAITPAYVPVPGDRLLPENLSLGYIFAFRALPSVIFFSALMALLYALGVIQPIVNFFARILRRAMGISGAEALSGAANIFVGVESLVVVRPYLQGMTRSELCAVLAAGFGSIASTVLALYSQLLRSAFPNITAHLVSASIMAIPACFVMAKILVPETEVPKTLGQVLAEKPAPRQDLPLAPNAIAPSAPAPPDREATSVDPPADIPSAASEGSVPESMLPPPLPELTPMNPMESVIAGAMDGVKLAVAIAALLIAVLGLVALVNLFFANLASLAESQNPLLQQIGRAFQIVTVQNIVGALFLPLTFLTGVSLNWQELWLSSQLIGQRLLETEVPAYLRLAEFANQGILSNRALLVISYALCGFAHIPSVGIFVGGLAGLIPSRRREIAEIGWKALWAATLGTLMIGCVAGLFDVGNPSILGK